MQAATAAIQGLAGGDLKAALAGGAAPYLTEVIKQMAPNETSRVMAHAVVAGVLAEMQGNNGLAGAAGASTSALAGEAIKKALYGDISVDQLTEQQKQTLVGLSTLAAGFAGGLAGSDSSGAITGAQAGQNEISNNMTSIGLVQQIMANQILNSAAMAEAGSQNPNDQAALALTKAAKKGLSTACLLNDTCVMMAIIAAQNHPKAPSNTGGDQILEQSPTNTGGNEQVDPSTSHTGNNQPSEAGAINTGNTEGEPNVGGNSTTTPIAEPNPDDLAYSSEIQLGRGSTGRTEANSLQEKLAIEQALSNPEAGRQLPIPMTDKRWPKEDGWVKMAQNINDVEVHYVRNMKTGQVDDFKFK
ncbi:hypothetical protein ACVWV0_000947 [Ewingella americana]